MTILSWFENFSEEEVPHENLWEDAEGLELHFSMVRDRREEGRPYRKAEEDEDAEMVGNDMADVFKK